MIEAPTRRRVENLLKEECFCIHCLRPQDTGRRIVPFVEFFPSAGTYPASSQQPYDEAGSFLLGFRAIKTVHLGRGRPWTVVLPPTHTPTLTRTCYSDLDMHSSHTSFLYVVTHQSREFQEP